MSGVIARFRQKFSSDSTPPKINRRTVDHDRIVGRHVDDLRIRLLDYDDALILNNLGFYLLLLAESQIAFTLSLFSHSLHSLHNVGLLGEKCVA